MADANLTGSPTGTLSANARASLLSVQEDLPAISIDTLRKRMFDAYDADQNGAIDEAEWQHIADVGKTAIGGSAQPLDFRTYDSATQSRQVYPSSLTILPFNGPQSSAETAPTSGGTA